MLKRCDTVKITYTIPNLYSYTQAKMEVYTWIPAYEGINEPLDIVIWNGMKECIKTWMRNEIC